MRSITTENPSTAMASASKPQAADRRRHRRLPVTVSAQVICGAASYRTEILDVSEGGMLLAPIDALTSAKQQIICIHSVTLGKVEARIVCVSRTGIHVQIELSPIAYLVAVERLASLTRAWVPR